MKETMLCKICKKKYEDIDDMFSKDICQKCWTGYYVKEIVELKGKPYLQKLLDNILD